LNGIANYLYRVAWEDEFRFIIVPEHEERRPNTKPGQASSQTQHVTSYKFEWQPGFPCDFSVTVLDSPGFTDTEGLERDDDIEDQMSSFFELGSSAGLDKVDAIVFVVQASKARLTANQRYIWGRIRNIFGADIGQNLLIAATFADAGDAQVVASIRSSGIEFVNAMKFNNCALFVTNSGNPADLRLSAMQWTSALDNYAQLIGELTRLQTRTVVRKKPYSADETQRLLFLQGIQSEIAKLVVDLERVRQQREFMATHSAQLARNENCCVVVTLFPLIVRPADGVAFCPICNAAFDSSHSARIGRVCPIGSHPSYEVTVPFTLHYEQTTEYWTIGQIMSSYLGFLDTRRTDLVPGMVSLLQSNEDYLQCELARKLQFGYDIAYPLIKCDYGAVLVAVEERSMKPGHAERLRWLKAGLRCLSRAPVVWHETRH
jgi:hypothetical protein